MLFILFLSSGNPFGFAVFAFSASSMVTLFSVSYLSVRVAPFSVEDKMRALTV